LETKEGLADFSLDCIFSLARIFHIFPDIDFTALLNCSARAGPTLINDKHG
jgi:hypothetical protein